MSQAIASIYNILAADPEIDRELSRSIYDKTLTQPAIYENWPGEHATIPYIILQWAFPQGGHWAKVNASLSIHIFVDNMDTLKIDRLRDRITFLLDWEQISQAETGGLIRVYKGANDTPAGTETPSVIHWLIDFDVVYYRNNFQLSK